MAVKKAKPKAAAKPDPTALQFSRRPGESDRDAIGRNAIRATVGGAITIKAYGGRYGDALEVMALVSALSDQTKTVADGNLKRAEQLLIVQAHTLDAIFNTLARRAALNMGEYLQAADSYLRLALKAQSQCRATLETLATIKNPPVVFAKQANIAAGPQQVNNGIPAPSRARETEIEQSKLLEAQYGERLDTGTAGTASQADSQLATVGAINRTKDGEGQGDGSAERL